MEQPGTLSEAWAPQILYCERCDLMADGRAPGRGMREFRCPVGHVVGVSAAPTRLLWGKINEVKWDRKVEALGWALSSQAQEVVNPRPSTYTVRLMTVQQQPGAATVFEQAFEIICRADELPESFLRNYRGDPYAQALIGKMDAERVASRLPAAAPRLVDKITRITSVDFTNDPDARGRIMESPRQQAWSDGGLQRAWRELRAMREPRSIEAVEEMAAAASDLLSILLRRVADTGRGSRRLTAVLSQVNMEIFNLVKPDVAESLLRQAEAERKRPTGVLAPPQRAIDLKGDSC